jgi:hypothetical protein
MKLFEAREAIAFLVIALFAYAFVQNPTEQLMIGALIGSFTTAVGFYLGGSKVGSDTAISNAATVAAAAAPSSVQDVKVVNTQKQPVPTHEEPMDLTGLEEGRA